jgi:hypothetical protein
MSSLRRTLFLLISVLFIACLSVPVMAQILTPQPSQKASVMQRIGVTDVTITYSRPGVKGRKIWGDPTPAQAATPGEATLDDQTAQSKDAALVPWGHVWRTGANDATTFTVTDDVLINGQKLPAGAYSLHTIPNKDEWTIVFNGTANQWGSFNYDATKDALRVKAKAVAETTTQEFMGFTIDPDGPSAAKINLRWERLRVPFTVEVADVAATTLAKIKAAVAGAKPDDWRTAQQAGSYLVSTPATSDDEIGMSYIDQSIKIKETFQNLVAKTNALYKLGKKEEAFAMGDRAVERGKADKANTANFEKRLADMKAGKV